MATMVYWSLHAVCYACHTTSHVQHRCKLKGIVASALQSCPDAIDEVFDSKLHIIGGVGITIGVIMVSV